MAAPSKVPATKAAAKRSPAKRASSARVRGRDTDSTRDAILRVVEDARDEGQTASDGRARVMDVDAAANFAAGLPDKYLDCRLGRHADKKTDFDDHGSKTLARGFSWRRYCPRCKFERTEHFDANGMLIQVTDEHYPEGYLAIGMGRVDSHGRGKMRIEKFKRARGASKK